jgi:GNAT superfamily N-acetyltransferase
VPARSEGALTSLEPEALQEADLPQNVALSHRVGWKDVESEWRVLHRAGHVCGVRHEGAIVAQGVLGDYGSCATIAKMVVDPSYQRRGLGRRVLDTLLAEADERGVPQGLVATEQGRPLYRAHGFEVSGEIAVLFGELRAVEGGDAVAVLSRPERAVELDARFTGCDRGRMLRARFAEASARLELSSQPGFALALAHGDHTVVGPLLAESDVGARALLSAVGVAVGGKLRVDVPVEHAELRGWLVEHGLAEVGVRAEMARGARRSPWQVPQRFALASQAWG